MISPIETIESLNKRLVDYFGLFETNEARWKVIWSEDMFEVRMMDFTDSGMQLIVPEPRRVRKCNYIKDRYVLCALTPVPEENRPELLGAKTSYEPIWTFDDQWGNPVAPTWEMIFALISTIIANLDKSGSGEVKYKLDEKDGNTKEAIDYRVQKLEEALFGNESKIGDSLALDSAVGYGPRQRKDWLH